MAEPHVQPLLMKRSDWHGWARGQGKEAQLCATRQTSPRSFPPFQRKSGLETHIHKGYKVGTWEAFEVHPGSACRAMTESM
eukprot:891861-Amphidinium_carterae.1